MAGRRPCLPVDCWRIARYANHSESQRKWGRLDAAPAQKRKVLYNLIAYCVSAEMVDVKFNPFTFDLFDRLQHPDFVSRMIVE